MVWQKWKWHGVEDSWQRNGYLLKKDKEQRQKLWNIYIYISEFHRLYRIIMVKEDYPIIFRRMNTRIVCEKNPLTQIIRFRDILPPCLPFSSCFHPFHRSVCLFAIHLPGIYLLQLYFPNGQKISIINIFLEILPEEEENLEASLNVDEEESEAGETEPVSIEAFSSSVNHEWSFNSAFD